MRMAMAHNNDCDGGTPWTRPGQRWPWVEMIYRTIGRIKQQKRQLQERKHKLLELFIARTIGKLPWVV
ncbi:hypothetical protein ACH5RR_036910 [Cinchona calisaya]|uniref:Uncharacterized protein n=1 Tax=Cinchona calisaya TaxID=153742 RepID=A0ABD2Y4L1_9GENT